MQIKTDGPKGLEEQRVAPRVAAYIPAQIHIEGLPSPLLARSRDIGTGGICVATASPFVVADIRGVSIEFPGRHLSIDARGCWQRDVEDENALLSGIQFRNTDLAIRSALAQIVQARAHELACFLDANSTIAELDFDDRIELATFSRLRQLPAGVTVYRTGDRRRESLFVVFRGCVEIESPLHAAARRVLVEGDVFGGLSLIANAPSIETCSTLDSTQLLEIDFFGFQTIESSRPLLARRLRRAMLAWILTPPVEGQIPG